MPRKPRPKSLTQMDWLIVNLRWLLLVSVGVVAFLVPTRGAAGLNVPLTIGLLVAGVAYNVLLTIILAFSVQPRLGQFFIIVADGLLSVGLIFASGGAHSSLYFSGLFPIITASLRLGWLAGLVTALGIAASYMLVALVPGLPRVDLTLALPVLVNSLVLVLAALLTGMLGDRMWSMVVQLNRSEEEAELRRLRLAREQVRAVFEMAGTLGATLSYERILEAILDIATMGFKDLGPAARRMVSLVLLYNKGELYVAASRHLTIRDQQKQVRDKAGVIAQSLKSAEPIVIHDPLHDPELSQFVALQDCKAVLCVSLRAGFETYGLVLVASRDGDVFSAELIEMLSAVCNQATIALQNAQLYQSLQQEKNRIVEIGENERKKLARDLHDGPTQSIAAIAMRINYTRKLLEREPDKVDAELIKIEELARRTTKEIRHMLFTLRPLVLETQGLVAALQQSIQKAAETDPNVAIHLEAESVEDKLDLNTQGVIFYIVEEAITNARKSYSHARNIWVRLRAEHDAIIAEVQDDGQGFDTSAVMASYDSRGSLGMVNMRERAQLVNGEWVIDSHPGQGTTMTLAVPLHKD